MKFTGGRSWGNMKHFSVPKTMILLAYVALSLNTVSGASFARATEGERSRLNTMGVLLASSDADSQPVIPQETVDAARRLVESYDERMIEDEDGDFIPAASEVEAVRVVQPEQESHHHHHSHPKPEEISRMSKSLSVDDEKRASELCGTSASLECGKRILGLVEGQTMSDLTVHTKCDLRDEFLQCIGKQKRDCLDLASANVFPQLPPKEVIKMEQGKLWKLLWTAGGCVLED